MNRSKDIAALEPQEWFARPAPAARPEAARETRIFDVSDLFALIQRGRKTILLTIAITTLAALAFGVLSPKRYTAATEILIDSRGYRVLANDVRPMTDGNLSLIAEYETELQLITSGEVLNRVVQKEKLTSNSEFVSKPGLLSRLLNFASPAGGESIDPTLAVRRSLERMVSVKRSERSFIASILVTTRDKHLSARLSQAIADTYLEVHTENRQNLTRRLAAEVAGRLQDLREKLSAAEGRLAAYQQQKNLVSSSGVLVSDQDLTELNKQLNEARARASRAKAQLDQIRRMPRNLGAGGQTQLILNSPTLVQLQVRVADARRSLAELRRNLGDQHPDIKAARARVTETLKAVSQEVARQREAVANEYEQARANERTLQSRIDQLKRNSSEVSEALIGARELKRAVEANRKVYEEFLVRARELTEQQNIAPSSSRVVTKATPPAKSSNVPLSLLMLVGMLAGLPLGVGIAFLQQYVSFSSVGAGRPDTAGNEPSGTEDRLRGFSAEPANVNFAEPDHRPSSRTDSPRRSSALQIAPDRNEIANFIYTTGLRRVTMPPEELLNLSMSLQKLMGETQPNVTLVCDHGDPPASARFAAGLAACLSYQGFDALLADGDPDDARLSQQLNLRVFPGLFDRFDKPADRVVQWSKAGLPHLLGSLPPGERKLPLGAKRFLAERLEDLASEVEYIIIFTGDLTVNPFAEVLLDAASQAILAGPGGSSSAEGQLAMLGEFGVPVIASVDTGKQPLESASNIPSAPDSGASVVSTHTDGQNDGDKKRGYFRRKSIVA